MISSRGPASHRPATFIPAESADVEEAAKLAEREADRSLFKRLQRRDFDKDSKEWRHLADRVARYATGVLVGWAKRGQLRAKGLRRSPGGSRLPEDLVLDEDEARSLVNEVLEVSLEDYRTRSLPLWNPAGGSSLTTWFINQCLYDLPDVLARWMRHELPPASVMGEINNEAELVASRHCRLVEEELTDRMLLDDLLENESDLREILERQDAGHSRDEVADDRGETVAAMRSKADRAKKRIRKRIAKLRKEAN